MTDVRDRRNFGLQQAMREGEALARQHNRRDLRRITAVLSLVGVALTWALLLWRL